MGVSGFHKFLESKGLVKPVPLNLTFGIVCIDLADLLHVNIRKSSTPQQLLKKVTNDITTVLKKIQISPPNQHAQPGLCIFMDGPAPLAKLSVQIKRRRTQAARGKSEKKSSSSSKKKRKNNTLDSLFLSPGTSLTTFLQKGLAHHFPSAYISGCQEPGEGEIKAIHFLLHHRHSLQGHRILLLGGDADLILLASAARPLTRITCAKLEQNRKLTGVSVDAFWKIAPALTREDLCVASMMRGNDYLPGFRGATFEHALRAAHAIRSAGGLVDTSTGYLRPQGLLTFLQTIPTKEPIFSCGGGCAPEKYFQGIAWTLNMYATGCCADVDYVFQNRQGPCVEHAIEYLSECCRNGGTCLAPLFNAEAQPLSCEAALLLLIPRWGQHVLPVALHSYMDHPELLHWYPPACSVCDAFRQARRVLTVALEGRTAQIVATAKKNKKNKKNNDDDTKKQMLSQIAKERIEFESTARTHVLTNHPELPPPVNVLRKLLGEGAVGKESPYNHPVVVECRIAGGKKKNNTSTAGGTTDSKKQRKTAVKTAVKHAVKRTGTVERTGKQPVHKAPLLKPSQIAVLPKSKKEKKHRIRTRNRGKPKSAKSAIHELTQATSKLSLQTTPGRGRNEGGVANTKTTVAEAVQRARDAAQKNAIKNKKQHTKE